MQLNWPSFGRTYSITYSNRDRSIYPSYVGTCISLCVLLHVVHFRRAAVCAFASIRQIPTLALFSYHSLSSAATYVAQPSCPVSQPASQPANPAAAQIFFLLARSLHVLQSSVYTYRYLEGGCATT